MADNKVHITNLNDDAFERLRVSNPLTLFDDKHIFGLNAVNIDGTGPARWLYIQSGGVATYEGSESVVNMITDEVSGSIVTKTTNRYFTYLPGKSQLIQMTGVLGSTTEGVDRRIGLFDSNNGVYFITNSTGNGVGIRSDTTGSIVDTIVFQNSWNFDKLDGSETKQNKSRLTLDITQAQVFVIDFQWLSIGSVRFGFMIDSALQWVHFVHHSNNQDGPYMRTPLLPITYEIKNTNTLTDTPTLKAICSTLISEGGEAATGATFEIGNGATTRDGIVAREPILALRLLDQFQNRDNRIATGYMRMNLFALDKTTFFELVKVTSPNSIEGTFTKVQSGVSGCEFSVDISSVDGGVENIVDTAYLASGVGQSGGQFTISNAPLEATDPYRFISQNFDSTESQIFIVYATSIPGTGAKVSAQLQFQEII